MKTIGVAGGHVAVWDMGQGPALVMIHGAGTPGELMRTDFAELSRDVRVITYDRRGYGDSSPAPGSWAEHRDDAATVIEELHAAPAVVVGYSAGAIVAIDLALERPELVAGLVLLDPAAFIKRSLTPRLVAELVKARVLRWVSGAEHGAESWLQYVTSYSTGGSAWDKAVPARRETILANSRAIFADLSLGGGEYIDESRLAGIEIPVTIVGAELSPPFLRRSVAHLRELMPQARTITLEGSSHIVMLDARDEVLDVLRAAVATDSASRAG